MKARVNLTLDRDILSQVRILAEKRKTSVSHIVESYLRSIIKKQRGQSVIDIVEGLKKPDLPEDLDLKEAYYKKHLK